MSKFGKTPLETPCIEWQGSRNNRGYGWIRRGDKLWLVHRWVWLNAHGSISADVHICHRCDNPACYNLSHLFAGNNSINQKDRVSKGRHPFANKTHCPRGHEYNAENTHTYDGRRWCRACNRMFKQRLRQQRKNAKENSAR